MAIPDGALARGSEFLLQIEAASGLGSMQYCIGCVSNGASIGVGLQDATSKCSEGWQAWDPEFGTRNVSISANGHFIAGDFLIDLMTDSLARVPRHAIIASEGGWYLEGDFFIDGLSPSGDLSSPEAFSFNLVSDGVVVFTGGIAPVPVVSDHYWSCQEGAGAVTADLSGGINANVPFSVWGTDGLAAYPNYIVGTATGDTTRYATAQVTGISAGVGLGADHDAAAGVALHRIRYFAGGMFPTIFGFLNGEAFPYTSGAYQFGVSYIYTDDRFYACSGLGGGDNQVFTTGVPSVRDRWILTGWSSGPENGRKAVIYDMALGQILWQEEYGGTEDSFGWKRALAGDNQTWWLGYNVGKSTFKVYVDMAGAKLFWRELTVEQMVAQF